MIRLSIQDGRRRGGVGVPIEKGWGTCQKFSKEPPKGNKVLFWGCDSIVFYL